MPAPAPIKVINSNIEIIKTTSIATGMPNNAAAPAPAQMPVVVLNLSLNLSNIFGIPRSNNIPSIKRLINEIVLAPKCAAENIDVRIPLSLVNFLIIFVPQPFSVIEAFTSPPILALSDIFAFWVEL